MQVLTSPLLKLPVFVCKHVFQLLRNSHSEVKCACDLVGRDLICPLEYTTSELQTLLWTAMDLKCYMKRTNYKPMQLLEGYNATVLLNGPHLKSQTPLVNAMRNLGGEVHVIIDYHWEESPSVADIGRCFSKLSHIILAKCSIHDCMIQLGDGASVPVVNISTCQFKPLQVLADLLTLQEHYGHLRKLGMGWIGPIGNMFNTYLIILPRMGMNMKFACICEPASMPQSPALFDIAVKSCIAHRTEVSECASFEEAVYKADVIATTQHQDPNMKITCEKLKDASVNWTFLHDLPRFKSEVDDSVFYSKNSLVWDSTSNLVWVTMAAILQLVTRYKPMISEPNFDGEPPCSPKGY